MGEVGAAVAGGIIGGAIVAGPAWQAGYDKCYSELQPVINNLRWSNAQKDTEIAELRKQLEEAKKSVPVLASVKRVLKL